MLLHAAEKDIDEKTVSAILKAAGVKADDARVKALVASLAGVDIADAMTQAVAAPARCSHQLLLVLQTPLPLLKRKRKKKKKLVSTVLVPFSVETGIERRRAHT